MESLVETMAIGTIWDGLDSSNSTKEKLILLNFVSQKLRHELGYDNQTELLDLSACVSKVQTSKFVCERDVLFFLKMFHQYCHLLLNNNAAVLYSVDSESTKSVNDAVLMVCVCLCCYHVILSE